MSTQPLPCSGARLTDPHQSGVHRLAAAWPKLESFSIAGSALSATSHIDESTSVFHLNPKLLSLAITNPLNWRILSALVTNLPPTLHSLALAATSDQESSSLPPDLVDKLATLAPQLTHFSFSQASSHLHPATRGYLLEVVPKLTGVRRLAVQPHAVRHLRALAKLPCLEELELFKPDDFGMRESCTAIEVAEVVRTSKSLKCLVVCGDLRGEWSSGGQGIVRRVTKNKGVKLVMGETRRWGIDEGDW